MDRCLTPCKEFAVFHSACVLSDQLYDGGLTKFQRHGNGGTEAVRVVCYAANEIRSGLSSCLSLAESIQWDFKLTAVCIWRTLASHQTQQNDGASFSCLVPDSDIIYSLPEWNLHFLFQLVIKNGWSQHFLQIINASEMSLGQFLMENFLEYLVENSANDDDMKTVTDVLEYLYVTENIFMYTTADNDASVMSYPFLQSIDNLLGCIQVALRSNRVTDIRLVLSLLNAFLAAAGSDQTLVVSRECLDPSYWLSDIDFKPSKLSTSTDHGLINRLLDYELIELPLLEVKRRPNSEVFTSTSFRNKVVETLQMISLPSAIEVLTMSPVDQTDIASLIFLQPAVKSATYQRLFLHCCKVEIVSLMERNKNQQLDDLEKIEGLQRMLKPAVEAIETCQRQRQAALQQPLQRFACALFFIEQRLEGFEEYCEWLLQIDLFDIIADDRFIECIEKNAELFGATVKQILQLLRTAVNYLDRLSAAQTNKLRKAVLRVFNASSLSVQNDVLQQVHVKLAVVDTGRVFDVGVNSEFTSRLLLTFNRMTSDESDITQTASTASSLALQHPLVVVEKLVDCVVQNKGHVDSIVRLLRRVPALCCLPVRGGRAAILEYVKQRALTCTEQQLTNVVAFCRHLVDAAADRSPLCSFDSFLRVVVIPNFDSFFTTVDNVTQSTATALRTLTLLSSATKSLENCDWSTLAESEPLLPVVYYLCTVIDTCRVSYVETDNAVKQLAVASLSDLIGAFVRHRNNLADGQLCWLHTKLCSLHWSLRFHFRDIFDSRFQVPFPQNLSTVMTIPANFVSLNLKDSSDVIIELMELAIVSEATLQMLFDGLHLDDMKLQNNLNCRLVFAVAQVMVYGTRVELSRITQLLLHMNQVPALAQDPSKLCSAELAVISLLTDCVGLLYNTTVSSQSDAVQCRVCENYAACVKVVALDGDHTPLSAGLHAQLLMRTVAYLLRAIRAAASPSLDVLQKCQQAMQRAAAAKESQQAMQQTAKTSQEAMKQTTKTSQRVTKASQQAANQIVKTSQQAAQQIVVLALDVVTALQEAVKRARDVTASDIVAAATTDTAALSGAVASSGGAAAAPATDDWQHLLQQLKDAVAESEKCADLSAVAKKLDQITCD